MPSPMDVPPVVGIDPKTEKISFEPKQGYVAGCGCRLKAKTTLPNAHCVINKW